MSRAGPALIRAAKGETPPVVSGGLLNPRATIRADRIGAEGEPVMVVDDALAAPDGWRALAAKLRYAPMGAHYPGVRAVVPGQAAAEMRDEMAGVIARVFDLDPVPPVLECFFSIVTTPPSALAPIQRLPHFDGVERERLAVLIYLSGVDQGGTAFYRQRATGYETITRDRLPHYEAALNAGVAKHGLPPPAYITGDTPLFEQIAAYEARPNRALVYRSCLLHCAHIAQGTPLPDDPRTGRLSINSFLFGT